MVDLIVVDICCDVIGDRVQPVDQIGSSQVVDQVRCTSTLFDHVVRYPHSDLVVTFDDDAGGDVGQT